MQNIYPHVHSLHNSHGQADPNKIIEAALANGLDGIVIVEHNSYDASARWEQYKNSDLLIMRGVEYTSDLGHILIYGIESDKYIPRPNLPFAEIGALAERLNWAIVAAHPFTRPGVYARNSEKRIPSIHALEVNLKASAINNLDTVTLATKQGIKLIAGSDARDERTVGGYSTGFFNRVSNVQELAQEIRNRDFTMIVTPDAKTKLMIDRTSEQPSYQ